MNYMALTDLLATIGAICTAMFLGFIADALYEYAARALRK